MKVGYEPELSHVVALRCDVGCHIGEDILVRQEVQVVDLCFSEPRFLVKGTEDLHCILLPPPSAIIHFTILTAPDHVLKLDLWVQETYTVVINMQHHTTVDIQKQPERVMEEPRRVMEVPGRVMEEPGRVMEEPRGVMEVPGRVIEEPGRVMEEPGRVIEEPGRVMEEPGRVMEVPGRVMEVPGIVMEEPGRVMEVPGRVMEVPGRVMEEPGRVMEEPGSDGSTWESDTVTRERCFRGIQEYS